MIPFRTFKNTVFLKPILSGGLILICLAGVILLAKTGILPDGDPPTQLAQETTIQPKTKLSHPMFQQTGEMLYRFSPLTSNRVGLIELWKQEDQYQLIQYLKNGSKYIQTVTPSADLKRFTPIQARRGEYYLLINSDCTLEAWDKDHRIYRSIRSFGC